jgi:hypothetical protein
MEQEWIRVEQLRAADVFRVDLYQVDYVCTSHPRMGPDEGTTAVETAGGLLTFRQGSMVQRLPTDH